MAWIDAESAVLKVELDEYLAVATPKALPFSPAQSSDSLADPVDGFLVNLSQTVGLHISGPGELFSRPLWASRHCDISCHHFRTVLILRKYDEIHHKSQMRD